MYELDRALGVWGCVNMMDDIGGWEGCYIAQLVRTSPFKLRGLVQNQSVYERRPFQVSEMVWTCMDVDQIH